MDDLNEISRRRICSTCVVESFLSTNISDTGSKALCFYCEDETNTLSINEVADKIEVALERHYEVTDNEPDGFQYAMMRESDYEWHRSGERITNVIASAAGVREGVAEDLRLVLEDRHEDVERDRMGEEGPFDSNTRYTEKRPDDIEYRSEWDSFEERLKQANRFFDPLATSTLTRIFDGLSDYRTHDGQPVVVNAGPNSNITEVYRARVFHKDDKLEEALKFPDLELGPPPSMLAAAGRMNAYGISVFYGAKEAEVALAEIRPPVGSRVVLAGFEIVKPLRLLNVKALEQVLVRGSIFDSTFLSKLERASFLNRLSRRITIPVMPGDEPLEYLITQVIADYLANMAGLDGIIYASVQVDQLGDNIALFHRASKVEPLPIPDGAEVTAQLSFTTGDGEEPAYFVSETVTKQPSPSTATPRPKLSIPIELLSNDLLLKSDTRTPTLKINIDSVEVRHILGISFSTATFPVQRHRFP